MHREEITNLTAGPSTLPLAVLEQAAKGLLNYENTGMGITELSHRSAEFVKLDNDLQEILGRHLHIPDTHSILFVQGGGSLQFSAVVLNLLARHRRFFPNLSEEERVMDYVVTGSWSAKGAEEAERLGGGAPVNIVQNGRTLSRDGKSFEQIADPKEWKFSPNPAFVYYCENETVDGIQFDGVVSSSVSGAAPLSFPFDLLPRDPADPTRSVPLDHALIFAGAQKNIGPAGLTILIVRHDLLHPLPPKTPSNIPISMDYGVVAKANSLYNTPPTFAMYVALLVLRHFEGQGGIQVLATVNGRKAHKVYAVLEYGEQRGVVRMRVKDGHRSHMNITFEVLGEGEEARFISEGTAKGFRGIKGHRSVGGVRLSLYNAVTEDQVDGLVAFILEFIDSSPSARKT
ncbi:hypothetical protein BS47DRAFT_1378076 [Hydnum rufescens UP504]|uniref:phosphoserine transaminase n=1 Tax=Hydnum rufescens UP504 TaxID=1448309 RepID=A0A9P6DM87_9AGAM|nr:hypothetical protein BS47DRAFT_1378076 [Hydnum rufescens UP504]